jgi:sugar O-acyltransferase (sialic acid O-acetyltransferase NeuD family)
MEKVVIFGTSAAAKISHFYLTHDSPYEVAAFTIDRGYFKEAIFCGLPVIPFEDVETVYPPSDYKMLVAILASRINKTREEKYHQAKAKGYSFISYLSSKAITWPGLEVGDNCSIGPGSYCGPFVRIGNNVVINPGASLGHDSVIKDHCFISSRAVLLGAVTVEPNCCLGANATILDGVTIARECVIGAGVVINENTSEKQVYRTNPPTLLPMDSDRLSHILFRGQR